MAQRRVFKKGTVTLVAVSPADRSAVTDDPAERFSFSCQVGIDGLDMWSVSFRLRLMANAREVGGRMLPSRRYSWLITALEVDCGWSAQTQLPRDQVTTRLLQQMPIDDMRAVVRSWAITDGKPFGPTSEALSDSWSHLSWQQQRKEFLKAAATAVDGKRGRPRRYTDGNELRAAAEQALACHESHGRAWRARLAEERGLGNSWDSAVARLLTTLRAAGWLAETRQGSQRGPQPGLLLLDAWHQSGELDKLQKWGGAQGKAGRSVNNSSKGAKK